MSPEVILVIIVLAFLIPLLTIIGTANRFTRLRNHIRESWADVDVQLQRRHDLIPNLVEVVKGYAKYEQELFTRIAQEREKSLAARMNIAQYALTESELTRSLSQLMARAEAYPELKASQHFLDLQEELTNTEDRIAAARRFYNANVREYNTMLESFPSSLIGSWFGHVCAPLFSADPGSADPIPVGF